MERERNLGIDVARGIAIILMVIGHCYSNGNIMLQWIYSFHMPFFFLISGVCAYNSGGGGAYQLIKYIKKLLIPYYIFEILYDLFLAVLGFRNGIVNVFIGNFIKTLFWEGNSATWFLPCLFLIYLWHNLIGRIRNKYYRGIVLLIVFFGAFFLSKFHFAVPIMRSLIGFGFYEIGILLKANFTKKMEIKWLFVIQAVFIILFVYNGMVSLFSLDFGKNIIMYILNGVLGSYLLVQYAYLFERAFSKTWLIKYIIFLGQNSVIMLTTHKFIIEVIRLGDYVLFGSLLSNLMIFEGIVFGAMVTVIEIPVMVICSKYFGVLFGKK